MMSGSRLLQMHDRQQWTAVWCEMMWCEQIAMLDNKQRESDRFLLVVKQQLVQAQQELFDELVVCSQVFSVYSLLMND